MKYLIALLLLGGCASSPKPIKECYLQTERGTCYKYEIAGYVHFMEGITHEVCCPVDPPREKFLHDRR